MVHIPLAVVYLPSITFCTSFTSLFLLSPFVQHLLLFVILNLATLYCYLPLYTINNEVTSVAETLVLAAKGPGLWWVMCAPGGVDRALGLCVWGEQCTMKISSCMNACVMVILPGTAFVLAS